MKIIYYKLQHRILYVNQKTYDNVKRKNNISTMCDGCNKQTETIIHAFYNCRNRKKNWNTFEPIIKKLNKNSDNNPITNILEKYNKYRTQNQETNNDNKYIHIERTWESKKSIKT